MRKLGLIVTNEEEARLYRYHWRRLWLEYIKDAKANNLTPLTYKQRTEVCNAYDRAFGEKLLNLEDVRLWKHFGRFKLVKEPNSPINRDGTLKKSVAYGRSVKRNLRDEEGNLIMIYCDFEQDHVSPFWYGCNKYIGRGSKINFSSVFRRKLFSKLATSNDHADLSNIPYKNDYKNKLIQNDIIKGKS